MRAGLRRCRNMRPTPQGPVTRRFGFATRWANSGRVGEVRPTPARPFYFEADASTFRARPRDNPSVVHTEITDCPWTADDLDKLYWSAGGTTLIVTHRDGTMRPQVFEYSFATDSWSRQDFSFDLSFQGEKRQPYHRFPETRGITMLPSGRTGTITVTFSDDILAEAQPEQFPSIVGVETTLTDNEGTAHSFNIPAPAVGEDEEEGEDEEDGEETLPGEGDTLIAIIAVRRVAAGADQTIEVPEGWASHGFGSQASIRLHVLRKIADGTETSPVAFTTVGVTRTACVVYRIANGTGNFTSQIVTGLGGIIDPPALTTSWSIGPTLWIAAAATDDNLPIPSPSFYSSHYFDTEAGFDPFKKSTSVTLSGGDATASKSGSSSFAQVYGVVGRSGKYVFTITPTQVSPGNVGVGLANFRGRTDAGAFIGGDAHSIGLYSTGSVFFNNVVVATVQGFSSGNTITVAMDRQAGLFWFRTGAGNWNNNPDANPETGAGGISIPISSDLFIAATMFASGDSVTIDVTPGAVPTGFFAWGAADVDTEGSAYVNSSVGDGNDVALGAYVRNYNATQDDPGQMSYPSQTYEDWAAITIAIRPIPQQAQGYAGVRFVYVDKEIEITSVVSPTTANATVIDELPPSQDLEAESGEEGERDFSGFSVGEIVEGETSGARGEITAKADNENITVQLYTNYTGFDPDELLIGPKSTAQLTSVGALDDPQAILNWREELVNNLRGWPGTVTLDRQRVIFTKLQQFPQAVLWSAVRTLGNFAITAEPDSALFEYVPGDVAVEQVIGGPDQFAFTTNGIYYIPISSSSPLAPGSVEFRLVSSESAASIKPVWMPQGLVFVSASRHRVQSLVPTGQTAQPYLIEDISQFHDHLMTSGVRDIAVATSGDTSPETSIYVLMNDGTIALARYDRSQEFVGWFPWEMHAPATSIVTLLDRLLACFEHESGIVTAEELDESAFIDSAVSKDDVDTLALFVGEEVDLWGDGRYLGTAIVQAGGALSYEGDLPGDAQAGFAFVPEVTPFAPNVGEGESIQQRLRRRKLSRMAVTVHESTGFNINERVLPNYLAGENQEEAPPRRSNTYRHRQLKREFDPLVPITQPIPGYLTIVEISMEVTV